MNVRSLKSTSHGSCARCGAWQVCVVRPHNAAAVHRLKASFAPRTVAGVTRMHSLDHAGWFVSDVRSDALARQLRGIPHAVVLANDQDRITVLVPNYEVKRPQVKDRPFGSHLVLQRSKLWADRTENRFFTYKLHPSGAFLETSTLASSLYLLLLRLLHRDYELVTRVVASCATDVPFSRDEEWIFSMLAAGNDDRHPDAVATRLRMRLVSEESNAGWASTELPNPFPDEDIGKDYDMYVTKFVHVSASYRLDVDEEIALLRVIPPKFHPRNRAVYLRALQSIQEEQVRHAACVVARWLVRSILTTTVAWLHRLGCERSKLQRSLQVHPWRGSHLPMVMALLSPKAATACHPCHPR